MSDLIERLRRPQGFTGQIPHHQFIRLEAADEIERLRAERDELRRQLAEMRAALVAAMGIVRNRREIISQQNQQVPEIWQAADKLDAVIAQADAAMGLTRPAEDV